MTFLYFQTSAVCISLDRGSLLEELKVSMKESMEEEFGKIKLELLSKVNSEINTSFNRYFRSIIDFHVLIKCS